jgi:hypothetical protein
LDVVSACLHQGNGLSVAHNRCLKHKSKDMDENAAPPDTIMLQRLQEAIQSLTITVEQTI